MPIEHAAHLRRRVVELGSADATRVEGRGSASREGGRGSIEVLGKEGDERLELAELEHL